MSYNTKEVQKIIGELLQYSCLDEAFIDMGTERIDSELRYTDVGENYRQILQEFANDALIK